MYTVRTKDITIEEGINFAPSEDSTYEYPCLYIYYKDFIVSLDLEYIEGANNKADFIVRQFLKGCRFFTHGKKPELITGIPSQEAREELKTAIKQYCIGKGWRDK